MDAWCAGRSYLDRAIAAVLATDVAASAKARRHGDNPDRYLAGVAEGLAGMVPKDRALRHDAAPDDPGGRTPRSAPKDGDGRTRGTLARHMPDWPVRHASERVRVEAPPDGPHRSLG